MEMNLNMLYHKPSLVISFAGIVNCGALACSYSCRNGSSGVIECFCQSGFQIDPADNVTCNRKCIILLRPISVHYPEFLFDCFQ